MKIKIYKYPNGKVVASSGLHIEVNKQKPVISEEIDIDRKEFNKLLENPKFKFSKKAKKIKT